METNRKKCYISVPMKGRMMLDIELDLEGASIELEKRGYTPVCPTDKAVNPDLTLPLPVLMGNDIRALLECEAFCYIGTREELFGDKKDKKMHKGCYLECLAAELYGKEIVEL